jgi:hypothetical protein
MQLVLVSRFRPYGHFWIRVFVGKAMLLLCEAFYYLLVGLKREGIAGNWRKDAD